MLGNGIRSGGRPLMSFPLLACFYLSPSYTSTHQSTHTHTCVFPLLIGLVPLTAPASSFLHDVTSHHFLCISSLPSFAPQEVNYLSRGLVLSLNFSEQKAWTHAHTCTHTHARVTPTSGEEQNLCQ